MKPASPKVDPLSFKTVDISRYRKWMDIIPFHQMHTGSHQERRSLCSGSHRGQCGWSSACSWPDSTPTEESQTSVKAMQYTVIVMLSFTRCALISKKNTSENCQLIHAINFKSLGKLQKTIKSICETEPMYLHNPVPTTRDNDGIAAVGGEAHTRNPLRVAVILPKKGT